MSELLPVLSDLSVNIHVDDWPHNEGHQGGDEAVDEAVPDCASQCAILHDPVQPIDDNQELALLEPLNSVMCYLVGRLPGVGLLQLLRNVRLNELLPLKARRQDRAGADEVYLDVLGVQHQLAAQALGETADGKLGRRVGDISGDHVEDNDAGSQNQMPRLLLDGEIGGEPAVQDGAGHLGGAKVVDVHLAAHGGHFRVEEELGTADAGDTPDNVRGAAIVPGHGFLDDGAGIVVLGDVGGDVVESLRIRGLCCGLGGGVPRNVRTRFILDALYI